MITHAWKTAGLRQQPLHQARPPHDCTIAEADGDDHDKLSYARLPFSSLCGPQRVSLSLVAFVRMIQMHPTTSATSDVVTLDVITVCSDMYPRRVSLFTNLCNRTCTIWSGARPCTGQKLIYIEPREREVIAVLCYDRHFELLTCLQGKFKYFFRPAASLSDIHARHMTVESLTQPTVGDVRCSSMIECTRTRIVSRQISLGLVRSSLNSVLYPTVRLGGAEQAWVRRNGDYGRGSTSFLLCGGGGGDVCLVSRGVVRHLLVSTGWNGRVGASTVVEHDPVHIDRYDV